MEPKEISNIAIDSDVVRTSLVLVREFVVQFALLARGVHRVADAIKVVSDVLDNTYTE